MVFVAGQVALEPGTSKFDHRDIKKGSGPRNGKSLKAILAAAGSEFSEVLSRPLFFSLTSMTSPLSMKCMAPIFREFFRRAKQ
jgi:enamine deaminase RidA (YjgF/YER057c/UK114 family)